MHKRERWLGPTEREREHMELERAATQILKADRRRRNRVSSPPIKRPEPLPVTENGWVHGLENLKRAMRAKGQS